MIERRGGVGEVLHPVITWLQLPVVYHSRQGEGSPGIYMAFCRTGINRVRDCGVENFILTTNNIHNINSYVSSFKNCSRAGLLYIGRCLRGALECVYLIDL